MNRCHLNGKKNFRLSATELMKNFRPTVKEQNRKTWLNPTATGLNNSGLNGRRECNCLSKIPNCSGAAGSNIPEYYYGRECSPGSHSASAG